jgi:hypothetical protein
MIGMFIDPRSSNHSFMELLLTSLAIGLTTFLFVLLVLPIAISILSSFKR